MPMAQGPQGIGIEDRRDRGFRPEAGDDGDDVVLASCYLYGGGIAGTAWHRVGLSHLANGLMKKTLGLSGLATLSSFYRVYRVSALRALERRYGAGILRSAGFEMAATVVRGGEPVFTATLPARLVLVMGAEGQGVDARLADACGLRVGLPGTGAVESLNVAAATAVFLAEWRRRHPFA